MSVNATVHVSRESSIEDIPDEYVVRNSVSGSKVIVEFERVGSVEEMKSGGFDIMFVDDPVTYTVRAGNLVGFYVGTDDD